MSDTPERFRETTADACVEAIIRRVGKTIVLGLPLGLGKPVRLVNALYERARQDPSIDLHILTAISMLAPRGSSFLERQFLDPFVKRLYGDVPELAYARDVLDKRLPANVKVSEFFFKAGSFLDNEQQQRNYICTNYTHAVRDLVAQGVNVICQMVAPEREPGGDLSLSCNPDLTLDLLLLLRQQEAAGQKVAVVGELNHYLPWLGHQAAVPASDFDLLLEHPDTDYPLFPVPQGSISPADHLIGFYASTLLKDGGTLQVGIGSLGAAVVHSTILRHRHNEQWNALYEHLRVATRFPFIAAEGDTGTFREGLYGCSEMMVDGFMHLMKAGILKREVYDDLDTQERANRGEPVSEPGVVMHGGFYLGPADFYQQLRELDEEERRRIAMTSVNYINDLYDHRFGSQRLKMAQRQHSRFINSAMMHTLSGAAISDGLEDGRVVSGVGGQYNFVAMAHDLPGARSIITLRSTRESGGDTVSNIVFSYGHCTIPRHLRDIVVTEYGAADLRGKSDEEVYLALIRIADARFQPSLLEQAQKAGKVSKSFRLPRSWQENTADHVSQTLASVGEGEAFPPFPFGCDFTGEELTLVKALQALKSATAGTRGKLRTFARAVRADVKREDLKPYLERMGLSSGGGPSAWLNRRLLAVALEQTGATEPPAESRH
ncbi:acetyl-CoA hydrolase/transferase C-terminal domain-containing protein [Marinobacter zhanjiangensis]|uniref:Acetyl-CoA hydrolase n=1 Tax=Marinobacter zhanjiangensis TaxID=578215 RepID=A0ABQ3AW08_9GAMM|nr:acetyl-CoA hydrolase/transferase C-terminal domain-containing protein [Marinobacter zhanjiangensis]GGY69067.1 acetyl-CoA hydrolase [Marinobacter zhanjiangensis]